MSKEPLAEGQEDAEQVVVGCPHCMLLALLNAVAQDESPTFACEMLAQATADWFLTAPPQHIEQAFACFLGDVIAQAASAGEEEQVLSLIRGLQAVQVSIKTPHKEMH